MKKLLLLPVIAAAGCTSPSLPGIFQFPVPEGQEVVVDIPDEVVVAQPKVTLDPTPAPPPPPKARTVEQFDTTSAEDRAAAVAKPEPAGEQKLGTTIATLGSPADPGIWIETPLVKSLQMGRVEYGANGKSVNLELRPNGKAAGAGSQISLPAMRLLDAPLGGLLELSVFSQ